MGMVVADVSYNPFMRMSSTPNKISIFCAVMLRTPGIKVMLFLLNVSLSLIVMTLRKTDL